MKKYIYMMLVVLAAGFTSCSNDDIPMEEDVTMKTFETTFIVDPSGVVEPYRFEWTAGELSKIPNDAQLRIRILIYDSNGEIVEILTQKQSNYQSVWSVKKELEAGTYTALVISDVVNTNDPNVEEYWTLEDYGKINDAKLTKNPKYLGYQKEILGMCNFNFSVESSNSSISLDLEPVGAVCYYFLWNLESYPVDIYLYTDVKIKSLFWDTSYNMNVERELLNDEKTIVGGIRNLSSYGYVVYLAYMLPYKNQYFRFYGETDEAHGWLGNDICIPNIKAGDQYFFECCFTSEADNYAYTYYDDVTGKTYDEWSSGLQKLGHSSRAMNVHHAMSKPMFMQKMNNAVYIKDLIKK